MYCGSSTDLWERCSVGHKNHAFSSSYRHPLFYAVVVEHGWEYFNLEVITTMPDYAKEFSNLHPEAILSPSDMALLELLTRYELTVVEQSYLDSLGSAKNGLNGNPWANASFKNLGATGMVRDETFRTTVSLAHQDRVFSEDTISLHRANMTGKILSPETRANMSSSYGGVGV